MIAKLLNDCSRLFVADRPQGKTTGLTLGLLVAIVALGAMLRFWGLGAIGLHGDEETMAMPTMHIVEHGSPLLPSGMFYPRAIGQLYLMAASVSAFGESEWALRLPSALCGLLLIVLAYFAGRRFLTPAWSLGLAAAVAFLPEFIIDSQTARMYVFLVTCIAAFLIMLFRWERTNHTAWLLGAVLALIVGLQFHTLAVFSALLLFFPGILQGDLRKLVVGGIAFAAVAGGFVLIDEWVASFYPEPPPLQGADVDALPNGPKAVSATPELSILLVGAALLASAAISAFLLRPLASRRAAMLAGALLALGFTAQFAFSYHAAFLLYAAAFVIAQRAGGVPINRLASAIVLIAALAVSQIALIKANAVPLRQIVGLLTGWPSVWPYLVISGYSVAAALLAAIGIALGLWKLAHREPVPDHVLFTVLGVWVPLLLIGVFLWFIPLRYASGQSLPLLIGGLAAAQWLVARWRHSAPAGLANPAVQGVAAVLLCVLIAEPWAGARTATAGYAIHPDHKGAAEFIKAQHLGPQDIVIAEDVLQQTYYLGRVDYWLIGTHIAAQFVHQVDGHIVDFYTNSPLISSSQDFEAVVERPSRGAIYIIGSGEDQADGRRSARGRELAALMEAPGLDVVYTGRDGLTKVWKVSAPARAAALE